MLLALGAHARAVETGFDFGAQGGVGAEHHSGAGNWINGSTSPRFFTGGFRRGRIVLGAMLGSTSTDTTFTGDPANGGRLLIGAISPVAVERFTESIETSFVLFTLRADLYEDAANRFNPYGAVAIGQARMKARVNAGTRGTDINNAAGRGCWSAALGIESPRQSLLNDMRASVFAEARYFTRTETGESARRGLIARQNQPYTPANNWYNARDYTLDDVDAPPGRMAYWNVMLGVRLSYALAK